MTAFYTHPNGNRCGWCIGGDHSNCVKAIEMGRDQGESEALERSIRKNIVTGGFRMTWGVYTWRCECRDGPHPASRCTKCQRAGVLVDVASRCVDQADCEVFLGTQGAVKMPHPPPVDALERILVQQGKTSSWGEAFPDDDDDDDDEDEDYEDDELDLAM